METPLPIRTPRVNGLKTEAEEYPPKLFVRTDSTSDDISGSASEPVETEDVQFATA